MPGEATRFKPGQSGNPNGRPKKNDEVTELAREESIEAFKRIVAIGKTSEDPKLALDANKYIIDRAIGKPKQQTELSADGMQVQVIIKRKEVGNGNGPV